MATYFVSVHTLLHRLDAEQAVEDGDHCCQPDGCLEDLEIDIQRTTQLKMIERKGLDARSASCPAAATTIRRPQRIDR